MAFLSVILAALGAFAFGAVWYMSVSKAWIKAAGVKVGADGKPQGGSSAMPFIIGFSAMVLVAGMMRHLLAASGVETVLGGIISGFGIGAFLITPWVAMNYAFAARDPKLTLIDGVNSVVGCAIMGAILTLF